MFQLLPALFFLMACTPRDPSVAPAAIKSCYLQSKKDCGPNGSVTAQGGLSNGKSIIDDFSLGIHSVERVSEVFQIIRAANDNEWAAKSGFDVQLDPGSTKTSQSMIVVDHTNFRFNNSEILPSNSEWNVTTTIGTDGEITAITGSSQNYRWSGQKNDLQIYIIENVKSFSITKALKGEGFVFKYSLPLDLKTQKAALQESAHFQISVQGLLHWKKKDLNFELESLVATTDLINAQNQVAKTLEVRLQNNLRIESSPCLQIAAEGTLTKIDEKGTLQNFVMKLTPSDYSVNKTPIKPSTGWLEQYPDCNVRPALDYLRLIRK